MNLPLATQKDFRFRGNIGSLLQHQNQKLETKHEGWKHILMILSMTLFFLFLLIVL